MPARPEPVEGGLLPLDDHLALHGAHGHRRRGRGGLGGDGGLLRLADLDLGGRGGARGRAERRTGGGRGDGPGPAVHGAFHVHLAHVDAATEAGAVDDDDARGGDVADHAALVGDLDRLGGGHVADHHAGDHAVLDLDLGLDDAGRLDQQGLGERQRPLDPAVDGQVLVAVEGAADEDRLADDGAAVRGGHGSLPLEFLDVHVDVALEQGAICDEDARRTNVAHHLAVRLELDLVGGDDVAGHLARNVDVRRLDVGLDDARGFDVEALAQADTSLDGSLDDQVLVSRDLTVDDDRATDDGVRTGAWRRDFFDACHSSVPPTRNPRRRTLRGQAKTLEG